VPTFVHLYEESCSELNIAGLVKLGQRKIEVEIQSALMDGPAFWHFWQYRNIMIPDVPDPTVSGKGGIAPTTQGCLIYIKK